MKGGVALKVGAVLKACRQRANLSQEDLAAALYVNQSDISKYETDVKEPTISVLNHWIQQTQTQEVMVAFLMGFDGINIMQQIIEVLPDLANTINSIIGVL